MEYVIMFTALGLYILSFIRKQKKAQQEAAQRRMRQQRQDTALPPSTGQATPPTAGHPRTIGEILEDLNRRIETQTKTIARPETQPITKSKRTFNKQSKTTDAQLSDMPVATSDVSTEDAAYNYEHERMEETIKQEELTNPYRPHPEKQRRLNLRTAIIAQTILQRPEW